jgi:hypothetical protein
MPLLLGDLRHDETEELGLRLYEKSASFASCPEFRLNKDFLIQAAVYIDRSDYPLDSHLFEHLVDFSIRSKRSSKLSVSTEVDIGPGRNITLD